ncbi:MAG TPA: hypothetical protein VLL54_20830 [Pyrinomonadaceae bacterium]|nr:hypothetical protein [Pyrinomonadaceae bacterium]
MSDYLNNIVARSLGIAEAVQPRVPQLFEQPVAHTGPALEAETLSGPSDRSGKISGMSGSRMAPVESASSLTRFETAKTRQEVMPWRAENSALFSASPVPTVAAIETSLPTTDDPRGIKVNATVIAEPATQQAGPRSGSALQQTEPAPSVTPAVQPSPTIVSTSAVELPGTTTSAANPQTGAPRPILLALANDQSEQSVPAVRITIGRVEVRAIMPPVPTPARTHSRPGPALSLESYLKQREEGKR